ncbi:MAG: PIG-L family deacetylase [candidate division WOR-3 bacterium]
MSLRDFARAFFVVVLPGFVAGQTILSGPKDGKQRYVILAPHPDDEVLACGGLVQQVLAKGDSVWVVYLTSGDGSWTSAAWYNRTLWVGPEEYIRLGSRRIDEARAGAAELGLPTECLTFLGYPDQALARLWCEHWEQPLRSPTTDVDRNPYDSVDNVYSGKRLMEILAECLHHLRPDVILCPNTVDAHSDHWATAAFAALVLERWPDTLLPVPAVLRYAPIHGSGVHDVHIIVALSPDEVRRKLSALSQHKTQLGVPGSCLGDLCRDEETFDTTWQENSPVVSNAPRSQLVRNALIDSLAFSQIDSGTLIRLRLKARPCPELDYDLFIHAVMGTGGSARHRTLALSLAADDEMPVTRLAPAADAVFADSVRVKPSKSGWEVSLPASWLGSSFVVYYLVMVGWRGVLLNHSDLGRATSSR